MFRVGFICFCMLIAGVKSNKKRLNVIESRLTTLEMRMNIENQDIKSTVELVETKLGVLNNSVSEIEEMVCHSMDLHIDTDRHKHNLQTKSENDYRFIKAFMEQKVWIHSTVDKNANITRQLELNQFAFEAKITKDIKGVIEDVEKRENENDEHLASIEKIIDSVKINVASLTQKLDREVQKSKTRETHHNKQLAGFQDTIAILTTNVTSLAQKNDYLAAELEKKDDVINDIRLEIGKLRETQNNLVTKTIKCPSGWRKFNMHCYLFEDTIMTYTKAKYFCSSKEAHLVDIENKSENDFVVQFSKGKVTWIGMTDEETEGLWKWDRSGNNVTYTNWRPGQPNNLQESQHYGVIGAVHPRELWDDASINFRARVVCKN
ncbi:asialoglycoprotein receptor 1-like [Mercenaria mercenaria]|uniref:asialoglycoprotein receptor 1-like n=1 Tax=Mercenaria mercenaria TaxID=6596 RepID=UPI00234E464D|nr:asialoglycoprotein receptor 1-like [Mercenaria mercenaria]